MSFTETLNRLVKEINGGNRKESIKSYEKLLSRCIEELLSNGAFYNLPLKNIFSIISKVDFTEIENYDKTIKIIQKIIKNITEKHSDEKETVLILQYLNVEDISFTWKDIISFLELITNCPILVQLSESYREEKALPEIDYEYALQQKTNEIEKFKQNIELIKEFERIKIRIESAPLEKPYSALDICKACEYGKLTYVKWLVENTYIDADTKAEAIEIASENGHLEIVIYLISKGFNINKPNLKGETLIHLASKNPHLRLVQYLILNGADLEARNHENETALHFACKNGNLQIVKYLLLNGACIEATNNRDETPLHCACEKGHLSIVEYLISKGSNIEATNYNYLRPLHYACEENHLSTVECLISNGAKIDAIDIYNCTPLHYAAAFGNADIVKYLVSKRANKLAKSNARLRPLDYARSYEIIKELFYVTEDDYEW